MSWPTIGAVLLLAGLAGCANPGPQVSTNPIDGSYQGRVRLLHANLPTCQRRQYGVIEVGDHTLFLAYDPATIFTVPVQDDGTVHAEMSPYVLDGRVANNRLAFTVTSPDCQTAYSMHFIWNHS